MNKNNFVRKWIWSYEKRKLLMHEALTMIDELEKPYK
jgi:hypothetical protein